MDERSLQDNIAANPIAFTFDTTLMTKHLIGVDPDRKKCMRPSHGPPQQAVLENRAQLKRGVAVLAQTRLREKTGPCIGELQLRRHATRYSSMIAYLIFKIVVTGDRSSAYNTPILATVLSSYCLNFLATFFVIFN